MSKKMETKSIEHGSKVSTSLEINLCVTRDLHRNFALHRKQKTKKKEERRFWVSFDYSN